MVKIDNQLYSGTIITRGRGLMKVTSTGMKTKFGQIASNLSSIKDITTPLQQKLNELTRFIGVLGIVLAVVVFILSFLEGVGYFPSFLLAISLAVAIVPEGLPAVMTITLAIGVKKMADKKAIIRKLSAIEALGSITLIATDKTGTLTTNKMKVKEVFVDKKLYDISHLPSLQNKPFNLLVLNGILCSTASLSYVNERDSYAVLGDPTEGALLYMAQQVDLVPEIIKKEWKLLDEKPFDSVSKTMSVIVQPVHPQGVGKSNDHPKGAIAFSKGAPESILAMCDKVLFGEKEEKLTEKQKGEIEKQVEEWARKGLRVLAFSYSKMHKSEILNPKFETNPNNQNSNIQNSLEFPKNETFLGLVAIHDAPRPEIVEAVKKAHKAGIKVVMITGDNEITAQAVGIIAGIMHPGDHIMTGADIDRYSDDELVTLLPETKIFARTNPFQKHRIVKLYQKLGEIVAVTGDGVNDAIALKQANVGVAMGLVGTDVARETADMVITDDNFATIVNAVEEGRNIIQDLKNAIQYLFSCNMAEALSLVLGLILGLPTLFYAIQLLYINLVTDGLPALTLAFSPRNAQIMQQVPDKELTLLRGKEKQYVFIVGVIATVLVLFSFYTFKDLGKTAAFSVLTLIQSFIFLDLWLSHRSLIKHIHLLRSPLFIIAFFIPFLLQFIIVQHPFISSLFKVQQVSIIQYGAFVILSSLVYVGIKGVKMTIRLN